MKKKVFLALTVLVLAALVFGACSASRQARHHRNHQEQMARHRTHYYGVEHRDENGHIVRQAAPHQAENRGCRGNYTASRGAYAHRYEGGRGCRRGNGYGNYENQRAVTPNHHYNAEYHGVTTRGLHHDGHHKAHRVTGPNYRYKTLTPQAARRVPNPFHKHDVYAGRDCNNYYYKNCGHKHQGNAGHHLHNFGEDARHNLHNFGEDTRHNLHNFGEDTKRNVKHGAERVGDNLHNFGEDTKHNVQRGYDGARRGCHRASAEAYGITDEAYQAARPNQTGGNGITQIMGGSLAAASFFTERRNGTASSGIDDKAGDGVRLPVIMYHSILKSRSGKFIVSPAVLEADMQYLITQGYTTVFTQDVIDYVKGNGELPEKPIIITFDDGYYNNMVYALPIFQKLGLKGVINIVGHYADKAVAEGDNNPNYSHLSWEQMKELAKSGTFEIGNHTYDMHNHGSRTGVTKKRGESQEDYRKALEADIGKLQCELTSKSGVTPNIFAYPFGKYSKETPGILKDMGFEAIFTCNEGVNIIRRGDFETLMGLKRYNRPAGISTEKFFERALRG